MGTSSRVLTAVLISLGILIAWHFLFGPKPPPVPPSAGSGSGSATAVAPPASGPASAPASQPSSRPAEATQAGGGPLAIGEGKLSTLKRDGLVGTFTSTGGALRHWELTNPRFKELRDGKLQQVDLVRTAGKGPWPLTVTFPKSEFEVPSQARFSEETHSDRELRYVWQSSKVRVTKHYVLDPVRSIIWLTVEVQNLTRGKLRGRLEASVYNQQPAGEGKASFTNPYPVVRMVSCYANGELSQRTMGAITGSDSGCNIGGCGMGTGPVSKTGEVLWVGSDDRYFLTAMVPQDKSDQERRCELNLLDDNVLQGRILYPETVIEPSAKLSHRFAVFLGPKDLGALDSVKAAGGVDGKLGDSIEFGWFAVLCRPMLWLMKIFHSWFRNWGIAIILLTIVVKLLTLYWTQKSMRSMKEMQRLKPKIDTLREKFKDDKQRLNQEMMALYKLHKVNPLGGCLPMLIQMPVWFALYRTLGNSVDLYREGFFGWIHDLTAPDPYYVLPILMGISMYAQQAITPQPMEGTQAKVMKYFMPGLFTVMMLALPSGLTLYIFVNTVLTMIHQWYMNKQDPPPASKPAPTPASRPAEKGQPKRRRKQTR